MRRGRFVMGGDVMGTSTTVPLDAVMLYSYFRIEKMCYSYWRLEMVYALFGHIKEKDWARKKIGRVKIFWAHQNNLGASKISGRVKNFWARQNTFGRVKFGFGRVRRVKKIGRVGA